MSNKTSDKNIANIENDANTLKELAKKLRKTSKINRYISLGKKIKETNKYYIMSETELIPTAEAIEEVLAELEQKDKRIQELERKNKHLSNTSDYETISLECTHLEEQLDIANSRIQELEKEKNKTQIISPYHVKENYIPKQAVIDKIKEVRSKRIKHEIDNKLLLDGVREKYLNNKGKFDSCELVTYCIHNEYLGEEHYLQELLEGEK